MHTVMHSLLTDLDTSNFTKAVKLASHKITLLCINVCNAFMPHT